MRTNAESRAALELVRRLEREVADLRSRLDALTTDSRGGLPSGRHTKEKLAWARRHGVDLDALEPFSAPTLGTHTMTVAAAARELGLSLEQVRRHLRSGRLRGIPLGGRAGWRVSRVDVARLRETREALSAEREAVVRDKG
jgi:excisionase family DNA binding protein